MTVQAQNSTQYYAGPIEIGTKLSIVDFTFIDDSHVSAKIRNNTEIWQYGTDYLISGAQTLNRTIEVLRRVAEDEVLAVYLDVPITQNISPEEGGSFPASTNEYVLDKLTYISQTLQERLNRAVQVSVDTKFNGTLPEVLPNRSIKINKDGSGLELSEFDFDQVKIDSERYKNEAEEAKNISIEQANKAEAQANIAITQASNAAASAASTKATAEQALTDITSAKNSAVNAIQNQETTSINAIKSQQTTSVNAVKNEGTTQVNLAKAEVTKATNQATNAANSASQAANTLAAAQTTINTEKTNAVNAVKSQQTSAVNAIKTQQSTAISAVQNQQTSAVNAVKSQQTSSVNTVKSTGQSYVDKCKAWASSPNVVEGGLRSAKYYAEMAQGKSDVTYEHLRASRVYNDKGMLLTDEEGYADVAEMNRSTFDLSKFTVVGSPTITDDGIASGFNNSNYIQIKNQKLGSTTKISIKTKRQTLGTSNETFFRIVDGSGVICRFYFNNTGSMDYQCEGVYGILGCDLNTTEDFVFNVEITPEQFKFSCFQGGKEVLIRNPIRSRDYIKIFSSSNEYFMDLGSYTNVNGLLGSIDLKQFSITVDGKEVFNGNKTGLDVFKEDNYTVAGSPAITSDGVVSNIGRETGHIQLNINSRYLKDKSWVIETPTYIIPPTQPYETNLLLFGTVHDSQFGAVTFYKGRLSSRGYTGDETLVGGAAIVKTNIEGDFSTLQAKFEFNINNGEYKLYYSIDGSDWVLIGSKIPTTENKQLTEIIKNNRPLLLHNYYYNPDDNFDLNTLKIYVDGQLVYQPCLKIPYNLSKNGAKVVPAYARDRVLDVYENHDKGYAYYAIDEENKNFTLPLGTTFDNSLRRNLENITENGNEKLATSLMYETGNVSNDEKGYKQLTKMNRSTFDLSKFTIVGSPTITEDGVASGFDYTNKIQVKNINAPVSSSKRVFKTRIKWITGSEAQPIFEFSSARIMQYNNGTIEVRADDNVSQPHFPALWTPKDNAIVDYILTITPTNAYMEIIEDGIYRGKAKISLSTTITTTFMQLGCFYANQYSLKGSINLSSISITVDNKEVFNGNKNGLDVIKEDNYAVVGSPVISDDGVASGFSKDNLIEIPAFIHNNKTWKIKLDFIPNNSDGYLFCAGKDIGLVRGVRLCCSKTSLILGLSFDGSALSKSSAFNITLKNFEKYNVEVEYTGEQYNVYLNGAVIGSIIDSTAIWSDANDKFYIGTWKDGTGFLEPFSGSIDLNSFKIYVDDQLVYQPCLKIPYNLSKTGSKIVPAYARDKVIDLYEQEGHAGYYTIDEEKKNFTLPMGEIFGLIGQRSLRSVTRDGANYCEIYSDKTIEQGGTCTANVEVTLQQPFADTNYVLSVPYSSKTETSFIPTQTGDWIAKGKGV